MPRSRTNGRGAIFWDRLALALLLTTIVIGVGLGGAGSLAVRTATTFVALAACGAIGLSCLCEGRWRFIGGSIWLLPIAVVFWAVLQFNLPARSGLALPNGQLVPSLSSSWNSLATIQFAIWGIGLLVAMFVAAHAVRSASRMRTLGAVIAGLLLVVGAIGLVQSAARKNQSWTKSYLGMYSAEDRRLSSWGRDWVSNETSFGTRSITPWRRWDVAADAKNDPTNRRRESWLEPAPQTARFGTYLNTSDWAAAAGMLAPFLLAAGASYLRRFNGVGRLGWDAEAPQGLAFAVAAALLVAAAAGLGDPLVGIAGYLFSLIVVVTMAPKADRSTLRWFGFAAFLFAVGTAVVAMVLQGGVGGIVASWNQWVADSTSLWQVLIGHWQTGAGFGAIGDVWPMYRHVPIDDVAPRGSSLLSLAAEAGAPLVGLTLILLLLGCLRWRRVVPTLAPDARLLSAGVGGALAAWLAHAALGPGGDAPSVMLLVAVFLGLAARSLAGAIRIPEGAWPK
jgi:hypothetical protein